jgi:hypothetical protein
MKIKKEEKETKKFGIIMEQQVINYKARVVCLTASQPTELPETLQSDEVSQPYSRLRV